MPIAGIDTVPNHRADLNVHTMFEDCLLESSGRPRKRSFWTTAASFALQFLIVGLLFLVPLFYTKTLSTPEEVTTLVYAPPPPPAAAPHRVTVAPVKVQKTPDPDTARLRTPTAIPKQVITPKTEEAPPPVAGAVGGVVGEIPGGVPGGVLGGVLGGTGTGPAVPKPPEPEPDSPQKIRVSSGVAQGNLIRDVRPQYPPLARQARIQGVVVLLAVIGKDGSVQDVHVKSGSPLLAQAAMEAVKQWRYRPYLLNGQPVEVDTQININFTLAGG
jgi:protein TonB